LITRKREKAILVGDSGVPRSEEKRSQFLKVSMSFEEGGEGSSENIQNAWLPGEESPSTTFAIYTGGREEVGGGGNDDLESKERGGGKICWAVGLARSPIQRGRRPKRHSSKSRKKGRIGRQEKLEGTFSLWSKGCRTVGVRA